MSKSGSEFSKNGPSGKTGMTLNPDRALHWLVTFLVCIGCIGSWHLLGKLKVALTNRLTTGFPEFTRQALEYRRVFLLPIFPALLFFGYLANREHISNRTSGFFSCGRTFFLLFHFKAGRSRRLAAVAWGLTTLPESDAADASESAIQAPSGVSARFDLLCSSREFLAVTGP